MGDYLQQSLLPLSSMGDRLSNSPSRGQEVVREVDLQAQVEAILMNEEYEEHSESCHRESEE
jgi:hypothetical protein